MMEAEENDSVLANGQVKGDGDGNSNGNGNVIDQTAVTPRSVSQTSEVASVERNDEVKMSPAHPDSDPLPTEDANGNGNGDENANETENQTETDGSLMAMAMGRSETRDGESGPVSVKEDEPEPEAEAEADEELAGDERQQAGDEVEIEKPQDGAEEDDEMDARSETSHPESTSDVEAHELNTERESLYRSDGENENDSDEDGEDAEDQDQEEAAGDAHENDNDNDNDNHNDNHNENEDERAEGADAENNNEEIGAEEGVNQDGGDGDAEDAETTSIGKRVPRVRFGSATEVELDIDIEQAYIAEEFEPETPKPESDADQEPEPEKEAETSDTVAEKADDGADENNDAAATADGDETADEAIAEESTVPNDNGEETERQISQIDERDNNDDEKDASTDSEKQADSNVVMLAEREAIVTVVAQETDVADKPDSTAEKSPSDDQDNSPTSNQSGDHVVIDLEGVAESESGSAVVKAASPETVVDLPADDVPPVASAPENVTKGTPSVSASVVKREEPAVKKTSIRRIGSATVAPTIVPKTRPTTARASGNAGRPPPAAPAPQTQTQAPATATATGTVTSRPKSGVSAVATKKPSSARKPTITGDTKKKDDAEKDKEKKAKPVTNSSVAPVGPKVSVGGAASTARLKSGRRVDGAKKTGSPVKAKTSTGASAATTTAAAAADDAKPDAPASQSTSQDATDDASKPEDAAGPAKEAVPGETPAKKDPASPGNDDVNLLKVPRVGNKEANSRDSDEETTTKQSKHSAQSLNADSMTYNAIPYLPLGCAVLCLILNIIIPGSGTIVAGFASLCCGQLRTSSKEFDEARFNTICINLWVGISQLVTVTLLLVGWFWSLAWGIHIVTLSLEYRGRNRKKAERAARRQQARAKLTINK